MSKSAFGYLVLLFRTKEAFPTTVTPPFSELVTSVLLCYDIRHRKHIRKRGPSPVNVFARCPLSHSPKSVVTPPAIVSELFGSEVQKAAGKHDDKVTQRPSFRKAMAEQC